MSLHFQYFIQDQYRKLIEDSIPPELELNSKADFKIIIGDVSYVKAKKTTDKDVVILIESGQKFTFSDLNELQPAKVSSEKKISEIANFLLKEKSHLERRQQIKSIQDSTEKKRNELEKLNQFLTVQSTERKSALDLFLQQENQKKNKEKKLLFFLDFINSEYHRPDFIYDLLKTLWVDLKKNGTFYRIGFYLQSHDGSGFVVESDGKNEKVKFLSEPSPAHDQATQHLRFNDAHDFSLNLANILQRPVGKITKWHIQHSEHNFLFYVESQGKEVQFSEIDSYITDRLSLIATIVQRWFLELREKNAYQKSMQIFKSYPSPMHVIDNDYNLIQSKDQSLLNQKSLTSRCYEKLAGRSTPCVGCPVAKSSTLPQRVNIQNTEFEVSYSSFQVERQTFHFVVYENKTEESLAKSQLIHAEKMTTIGQLANHLTHELNNPLTGLKLYAEMILQDKAMQLQPTYLNDFNEILKAIQRCQIIIRDLGDFTKDENAELQPVDFSIVVQKTLVFLKSLIRSHRIFIDLKPTVILANPVYLQQILFNLIKNSCQAMPEKGTLKIYQIPSTDYFDFIIEDDGPGLPVEMREVLFKPFYTTKAEGQGTGLGLYISQKLMQRMNAELIFNDQFKKGTQFVLRFKK